MRIPINVPTLALTIALTFGAGPGLSRSGSMNGSKPTITLRLIVEDGIDRQKVLSAQETAAKILKYSGIDLAWLICKPGQRDGGSGNACERDLGRAEFWMRVVTHRPVGTSATVLGFTEFVGGCRSDSAGVYYPAAVDGGNSGVASVGEILGAAIAHEVGHLILGAHAHSSGGVMYASWGQMELRLVHLRQLYFSTDQAKLLRERVGRNSQLTVAASH
jgi:hypothetical protein